MLLNSSGRVENLLLPGELDINQLGEREKIRNEYSLESPSELDLASVRDDRGAYHRSTNLFFEHGTTI